MSINNALDHEEQALLEAYETGQFESVLDDNRRDYLARIAQESLSIEYLKSVPLILMSLNRA